MRKKMRLKAATNGQNSARKTTNHLVFAMAGSFAVSKLVRMSQLVEFDGI